MRYGVCVREVLECDAVRAKPPCPATIGAAGAIIDCGHVESGAVSVEGDTLPLTIVCDLIRVHTVTFDR
jgi:hypothetical protein